MKINFNCRFYKGVKPCDYNKKEGVICENCSYYNPYNKKILIIKLDAIGDVLRTTCILQGLKKKYPDSYIEWITCSNSIELLKNNPYIDEVLEYNLDSYLKLQNTYYDLVINPSNDNISSSLLTFVKGKTKKGFGIDKNGSIYPINDKAKKWLLMGIFDCVKKENKESYQRIVADMVGIEKENLDIILELTDQEKEFSKKLKRRWGLKDYKIIGINTGSGMRWPQKMISTEQIITLINKIQKIEKVKILLLGGPEERNKNREIIEKTQNVIDTGCDNSLREFCAIVSLCDMVICGDTLALHIASGLRKKTIALFGPTSSAEIEDYEFIIKIQSDIDCLCCYSICKKHPNCMDLVDMDKMVKIVKKESK